MSNVMQGASALMAKYKNVQLAHTVTLGSQSVHHVQLEISVSVDSNSLVLQELQVLVGKMYVQLALKDLPALREPQSQLSVNLDPMLE